MFSSILQHGTLLALKHSSTDNIHSWSSSRCSEHCFPNSLASSPLSSSQPYMLVFYRIPFISSTSKNPFTICMSAALQLSTSHVHLKRSQASEYKYVQICTHHLHPCLQNWHWLSHGAMCKWRHVYLISPARTSRTLWTHLCFPFHFSKLHLKSLEFFHMAVITHSPP